MVPLYRERDYLRSDFNLFNRLTDEMSTLANSIPVLDLAMAVHGSTQLDKTRGNIYIDVGFASDRNSRRTQAHGGVSTPQLLDRSTEPIFQQAMLAMTKMAELACQPKLKDKAFVDNERTSFFAGSTIQGNRIETLRVALTNGLHLVDCHVDDKNDVAPNFQGVVNYSKWLFIEGVWPLLGTVESHVLEC